MVKERVLLVEEEDCGEYDQFVRNFFKVEDAYKKRWSTIIPLIP